jgi:hypothetical protein
VRKRPVKSAGKRFAGFGRDLDSCSKNGEKPNPRRTAFPLHHGGVYGLSVLLSARSTHLPVFSGLSGHELAPRNASVPEDLHSRIIDAIVGGDCDTAERVMREHVYDSYEYVMRDIALLHQRQSLK